LENCRANGEEDSLSEAIFGGFVWTLTPQGSEYWRDIKLRAIKGEFDTPQPNLHGWIPVSERLPNEASENYLVVKNGVIDISLFRGDWNKFHCELNDIQKVTHWQPLPKLPENL
jgi:hypothetical protein